MASFKGAARSDAASGAGRRPTTRALGETAPRSATPWVAPGDVSARSPFRASTDAPQVTGPTSLLAALEDERRLPLDECCLGPCTCTGARARYLVCTLETNTEIRQ